MSISLSINKINSLLNEAVERVFNYISPSHSSLQPILVERAIERAIEKNVKVFKKGVLPPNRIMVVMSPEDFNEFKKIEGIYLRQLEQTIENFIENSFKEQAIAKSKVFIAINPDPKLSKGQIKVFAEHLEV